MQLHVRIGTDTGEATITLSNVSADVLDIDTYMALYGSAGIDGSSAHDVVSRLYGVDVFESQAITVFADQISQRDKGNLNKLTHAWKLDMTREGLKQGLTFDEMTQQYNEATDRNEFPQFAEDIRDMAIWMRHIVDKRATESQSPSTTQQPNGGTSDQSADDGSSDDESDGRPQSPTTSPPDADVEDANAVTLVDDEPSVDEGVMANEHTSIDGSTSSDGQGAFVASDAADVPTTDDDDVTLDSPDEPTDELPFVDGDGQADVEQTGAYRDDDASVDDVSSTDDDQDVDDTGSIAADDSPSATTDAAADDVAAQAAFEGILGQRNPLGFTSGTTLNDMASIVDEGNDQRLADSVFGFDGDDEVVSDVDATIVQPARDRLLTRQTDDSTPVFRSSRMPHVDDEHDPGHVTPSSGMVATLVSSALRSLGHTRDNVARDRSARQTRQASSSPAMSPAPPMPLPAMPSTDLSMDDEAQLRDAFSGAFGTSDEETERVLRAVTPKQTRL